MRLRRIKRYGALQYHLHDPDGVDDEGTMIVLMTSFSMRRLRRIER
jgi:hypothetical protein